MKPLGKAISEARAKKKLSLRALAKKAKLSHQSVYRLEQGFGGMDAAARVMRVLGFAEAKMNELLGIQVAHVVRASR